MGSVKPSFKIETKSTEDIYLEKLNYDIILNLDLGNNTDKESILRIFSESLKFPRYYGNNWDALYDSLKDLEWLNGSNVLIVLSNIHQSKELKFHKVLIEILNETKIYWRNDRKFNVYIKKEDSTKSFYG